MEELWSEDQGHSQDGRSGRMGDGGAKGQPSAVQTPFEEGQGHDCWPSISGRRTEDVQDHPGASGVEQVKYLIIYEKTETGYSAYVPDLPGCISTGKTIEETERNIREAIEGHLKTLREFGEPIPRPTSVAKAVEVSAAA